MIEVVCFPQPLLAELRSVPESPLAAGEVRIRTMYSGISAGTELTAYRGANPYLARRWDADHRLFVDGEATLAYPVVAWGYEEVGRITEVADDVEGLEAGDIVWGAWGHRSSTVVPSDAVRGHVLPADVDPLVGIFAKIAAIALNAVHDAELSFGDTVVVFGLGVPGQIVCQLARLSGARVIGVDPDAFRRDRALALGCDHTLDPTDGDLGVRIRQLTDDVGADAVIEISGVGRALHEAVRSAAYNGRVVVSGFHQGAAVDLRLGEEFHHNRVSLVSSQISGVATGRASRWDERRLSQTVMSAIVAGRMRVGELVTHSYPASRVGDAFRHVDEGRPCTLQVVLDFRDHPADEEHS